MESAFGSWSFLKSSCVFRAIVLIWSMSIAVSRIVRFLFSSVSFWRVSVESSSLNSIFGKFCFSWGRILRGRLSCFTKWLPNTRIFILGLSPLFVLRGRRIFL